MRPGTSKNADQKPPFHSAARICAQCAAQPVQQSTTQVMISTVRLRDLAINLVKVIMATTPSAAPASTKKFRYMSGLINVMMAYNLPRPITTKKATSMAIVQFRALNLFEATYLSPGTWYI